MTGAPSTTGATATAAFAAAASTTGATASATGAVVASTTGAAITNAIADAARTTRTTVIAAIATAAQQLPPLNQAEAKQMAREAGWSPPEGASLEEGLQRFASRVWGRSWPAPHPGNAEDTPGSDLPERRNAIAAAAAQLLSC